MCLIIASPEGKVPTCGVIDQGWRDNSDGWGLMYSDGKNIVVKKGMNINGLKPLLTNLNGAPYVLHYRWATHGTKGLDNCHPFKVTKKLYMAHNGVINIDCTNKLMSDTWHFAQLLRGDGLDHTTIKEKEVIKSIEKAIGKSNKLAFLDDKGSITLANEDSGTWKDGVWFSNTNSFPFEGYGWESYFNRKYVRHNHSYYDNIRKQSELSDKETKKEVTWKDSFYYDDAEIWDVCEGCGHMDWLEEAPECKNLIVCADCRRTIGALYKEEYDELMAEELEERNCIANEVAKQQRLLLTERKEDNPYEGLNDGVYYDSKGVAYSWDDPMQGFVRVGNKR